MADFKLIISVQVPKDYTDLIEIVNKKYNFSLFTDLTMLQNYLEMNSLDTIVIFMDSIFINEMNEGLLSILQKNEYFIVGLYQDSPIDLYTNVFLYDSLDCNSIYHIEKFLIRLEKDIYRQLDLFSIKNELSRFYDLGKKLTAEKDIQILLELIIDTCIEIANSDAGTIYIVIDEDGIEWSTYEKYNNKRKLKFAFAKNKSMEIDLVSMTFPILKSSISGYTVMTGKPLSIDDAYSIPDHVEYKFNTQFDKSTGYKTKSILSIPMKDHQNKVMGVIQLLNKKGINNHIIPFSAKDSSVIDALAGVAAVVLENNFLYKKTENLLADYKLTIDEEINRRKQADEEINKLLSAVEHSPNTVIITDVNGTILYVNPKFTELTGYEYKEVIGKTPGILNSGYLSEEFYNKFWETILEGRDWSGEFYNKKKDGTLYWESTRISSLKAEDGSIKYFISVREDITEKKLITQKLAEKNAELQEIIKKLHTTQAQLIQSEKMAGIGQLAAGVAHEINNPIGFAMSNIETLKKYVSRFTDLLFNYQKFKAQYFISSDAEKKQMLENIDQFEKKNHIEFLIDDLSDLFQDTDIGLKRVNEIVASLRIFSCIDQLDNFISYDLNEGIRSTLIIANNELTNVSNVYAELGDIPLITALGTEINQVLLNLVMNAVYAIKTKSLGEEGIITIKTYQKDQFIYCEIHDNGIGMEEKIKNRIFEPFFTTKPVGSGTGLGLSLVYDVIVKKHLGEVLVESEFNKGSIFTIKLPIHRSNA